MFDGAASCSLSLRAARVPAHKHRPRIVFAPGGLLQNSSTHVFVSRLRKRSKKKRGLPTSSMRCAAAVLFLDAYIVIVQKTTVSQSFKNEQMMCGQLSLLHKSLFQTVFVHRHYIFYSKSLQLFDFFLKFASLTINFTATIRQCRSAEVAMLLTGARGHF